MIRIVAAALLHVTVAIQTIGTYNEHLEVWVP